MGEAVYGVTILLGALLGLEHALEPDHVAAVSTFVSETKSIRRSARIGALWGLGHTLTLLSAGLFVLITKATIPGHLIVSFELMVGVMLIILGVSIFLKSWRWRVHIHPHGHGERSHIHLHAHRVIGDHRHDHRPFAVGVVHGLAGSGALYLLVLSTVSTVIDGLIYIALFGVGVTVGMVGFSGLLGLPFLFTAHRYKEANMIVKYASGLISCGLGLTITFNTGLLLLAA